MREHQRFIFLLDGLGALLSILCLTFILCNIPLFGLNSSWLKTFILIASLLSLFSISRHILQPKVWRTQLKLLAIFNLFYCLLTTVALLVEFSTITMWGWIYFVAEIVVVVILALWEYRIATKDPA